MKTIWVLGTGGTIAGRADRSVDNVGYVAGEVGVSDLLAPLRASLLAQCPDVNWSVRQVAQIDSKDMDHGVLCQLAREVLGAVTDPSVDGVVVTHGTDTIEETAHFLSRLVPPSKPVILTCAMRPASAVAPDGPQNLLDACLIAAQAAASGVWVVALGAVHAPDRIHKHQPYRLDAFISADGGPAGVIEEGRLRWLQGAPLSATSAVERIDASVALALLDRVERTGLPRVELVFSHADVSGRVVDALLEQAENDQPLRGLIVAGTGNGTVHRRLLEGLKRAEQRGVAVRLSSRCMGGRPVGSGGWPSLVPLNPYKARLDLALKLALTDLAASR